MTTHRRYLRARFSWLALAAGLPAAARPTFLVAGTGPRARAAAAGD